ncbi:hypothetical protein ACWX0O_16650 [Nitrobacteraceae bacterium UC4449_H16]
MICSRCHQQHNRSKQRYCGKCHAEAQREFRRRSPRYAPRDFSSVSREAEPDEEFEYLAGAVALFDGRAA